MVTGFLDCRKKMSLLELWKILKELYCMFTPSPSSLPGVQIVTNVCKLKTSLRNLTFKYAHML